MLLGSPIGMAPCWSDTDRWELGLVLGAPLGVLGTTGLSLPDTNDASTAVVLPAVAISPAPTSSNSIPKPLSRSPC